MTVKGVLPSWDSGTANHAFRGFRTAPGYRDDVDLLGHRVLGRHREPELVGPDLERDFIASIKVVGESNPVHGEFKRCVSCRNHVARILQYIHANRNHGRIRRDGRVERWRQEIG